MLIKFKSGLNFDFYKSNDCKMITSCWGCFPSAEMFGPKILTFSLEKLNYIDDVLSDSTAQKMKFSMKDFFGKCDQSTVNCGFGQIY